MTNLEKFTAWAEDNDAVVEIVLQGKGITVVDLRLPHLWHGEDDEPITLLVGE